mmetsp:Transcript_135182/g.320443  ORF Transcript_135182/g.320443 Transcript_135182/m.320443 type:complete len:231 (+) Transcript_135182:121-813(+)
MVCKKPATSSAVSRTCFGHCPELARVKELGPGSSGGGSSCAGPSSTSSPVMFSTKSDTPARMAAAASRSLANWPSAIVRTSSKGPCSASSRLQKIWALEGEMFRSSWSSAKHMCSSRFRHCLKPVSLLRLACLFCGGVRSLSVRSLLLLMDCWRSSTPATTILSLPSSKLGVCANHSASASQFSREAVATAFSGSPTFQRHSSWSYTIHWSGCIRFFQRCRMLLESSRRT